MDRCSRPSDMKGTRMNQFVAPTSFMTDTSRRRAKMAMRMVLRMRTAAETMSTTAMERQTHFEMLMNVSSLWMVCWGSVTALTPGDPLKVRTTWAASVSATGVHQNEVGISFTVTAEDSSEVSSLWASEKF